MASLRVLRDVELFFRAVPINSPGEIALQVWEDWSAASRRRISRRREGAWESRNGASGVGALYVALQLALSMTHVARPWAIHCYRPLKLNPRNERAEHRHGWRAPWFAGPQPFFGYFASWT